MWDAEGIAQWAYRVAEVEPHQPLGADELAEILMGPGAVSLARGHVAKLVERPRLCGGALPGAERYTIEIAPRIIRQWARFQWLVAHELGELLLRLHPAYVGEDVERYANAVGACIIAPRQAVQLCLAESSTVDPSQLWIELADRFDAQPLWGVLRWAEVTDETLAVVTPSQIHRRGVLWPPTDSELRQIARGRGSRSWARVADLPGEDRARVVMIRQSLLGACLGSLRRLVLFASLADRVV